jgi:4-aminobutyrate aminotransferase-like enzyme
LMVAVDIVNQNGAADPERATRLVNQLAQHGVLISTSRKDGSALKIRPPLTFSMAHLDLFLDKLTLCLKNERNGDS